MRIKDAKFRSVKILEFIQKLNCEIAAYQVKNMR